MTLRPATQADLPAVLTLLDSYYTEFDIWQRDDPTYTARTLAPTTDGTGYFLALPSNTPDDIPAACVMLRPLALPNLEPAIQGTAVECKRLYVLPAFRGNKLAGPLMDLAEQTARTAGHTWIYLDSKAEFQTAIAMYRRRGYEEIPRFNTNPQATIFMRKQLRASSL